MSNSKLTIFTAKRVLICYILLSIIDVVFMKQRWYILVGMFLGAIVSLIRFRSYEFVFSRIFMVNQVTMHKGVSIIAGLSVFVLNQLVLFPLLLIAYKFRVYFFAGMLAGILLLPLMLFVNCLTEATGITHNNFE